VLGVVDDKDMDAALIVSRQLREAGFSVDLQTRAFKPGKLKQLAETRGVRYALWIEGDRKLEHKVLGDAVDRDAVFTQTLTAVTL
jgi:histidyl-tRNA synthetase